MPIQPIFAANAAVYAIQKRHHRGQDYRRCAADPVAVQLDDHHHQVPPTVNRAEGDQKIPGAYSSTRDPLDIQNKGEEYDGAPTYQLYIRGADELAYQLKHNPVQAQAVARLNPTDDGEHTKTDFPPSPPRLKSTWRRLMR